MKIETIAIHAGNTVNSLTGEVIQPISLSTTFERDLEGNYPDGYMYTRSDNPNRRSLEKVLAALEHGADACAFSSGNAAGSAVFQALDPGSHVIAPDDMYHGLRNALLQVFKGVLSVDFVDTTSLDAIEKAIKPTTRLIWLESPSNPLLKISDIAAICSLAKKHGIKVACDNTFATPIFQCPLALGADIVMHSTTKYLGGHSDVIQGCLVMNDEALRDQLYFIQKSTGAVPGPQDCFLVLRGIKTLHVRMQRHCENGEKVAAYLRQHPKVAKVYWCGFSDHPNHDIAKRQMRGFGGMMSFTLKDDSIAAATKVLSSTKIFSLAESLGGVESLINHPASMTHASIPREQRIANGLADGLIRLSVGIEDAEDIIADLAQAIG